MLKKCLQIIMITKNSFDTLIFNHKQPQHHQSSSPFEIRKPLGLQNQTSIQSFEFLHLEFVFAMSEVWTPLNL